jgi:predicted kinase
LRVAACLASDLGSVSRMGWTGLSSTRLVVLRGNSASGKSSVAAEIRSRYGRGIAIVGQDNLRRTVLRERDIPGGANIGLIDTVARYALDRGYHTIVEGILSAARYADMLSALCQDHRGISRLYYLDVPFEETMRRHATKPQAAEYGRAEMSGWYLEHDLIPGGIEHVVPASSSLDDTVERILGETGLYAHDAALLAQQP